MLGYCALEAKMKQEASGALEKASEYPGQAKKARELPARVGG
jgi:hypothetical protein